MRGDPLSMVSAAARSPGSRGMNLTSGRSPRSVDASSRACGDEPSYSRKMNCPGGGFPHTPDEWTIRPGNRSRRCVLAHAGLLEERAATSFPGFLNANSAPGIRLREEAVVVDGKVVTSRGAGTAMEFGLALIGLLEGAEVRQRVAERLQRAKD